MSESVGYALEHTGGKEVEETIKFIRMIDKLLQILKMERIPIKPATMNAVYYVVILIL